MSARKANKPGAVVVSACLLGRRCRFDGQDKFTPELAFELEGRRVVPLCPEELGALGTPRPPCRIAGGGGAQVLAGKAQVIDAEGRERTAEFIAGAQEALRQAQAEGATEAILKDKSPSCGVKLVYRTETEAPSKGEGVFAALLRAHGIVPRSAD